MSEDTQRRLFTLTKATMICAGAYFWWSWTGLGVALVVVGLLLTYREDKQP